MLAFHSPGGAACAVVLLATLTAGPVSGTSGFVPSAGSIWVKIGYSFWSADERFAGPLNSADLSFDGGRDPGDRVPLKLDVEGANFTTQSIALNLEVTPVDRFVVGLYFPVFQRTEFDQATIRVITQGTGDLFGYAGVQLTPPGLAIGSSLYLHAKLPTTEVSFEDLSVPLSEGQVDLAVEQVTTWAIRHNLHLSGRLLYRVRFEVEQTVGDSVGRFKPGNETELGLEIGGAPTPALWLRASWNALLASATQDRSIEGDFLAIEQREVHNLEVGAYLQFGHWVAEDLRGVALDAWLRHPAAGSDYPVGPSFGIGLAYGFNWHD